jgi:DNA excision repair protein ERCC-8
MKKPSYIDLYLKNLSSGKVFDFHDLTFTHSIERLRLSTQHEFASEHLNYSSRIALEDVEDRYLLSGGGDGKVLLYDLYDFNAPLPHAATDTTSIKCKPLLVASLQHNKCISAIQWYPGDTGIFITSGYDGKLLLWDTNRFEVAYSFQLNVRKLCKVFHCRMHPDSSGLIACALDDNLIRICDPRTGDSSQILSGHHLPVTRVEWSPVNQYHLISSCYDGTIKLWDTRKAGNMAAILSFDLLQDHTAVSTSVAAMRGSVTSTGSASRDGMNMLNWKKDAVCKAHDDAVMSIKYSSCGNYLVSSGNDHRVRLWDAASGKLFPTYYTFGCKSKLPYDMEIIPGIASAKRDLLLFPSDEDNELTITDVHTTTGTPIHSLKGHVGRVQSVAYSKIFNRIVSASKDGLILLWTPAPAAAKDSTRLDDAWSDDEDVVEREVVNQEVGAARRVFVPPIIQRYIDDAAAAHQTAMLREANIRITSLGTHPTPQPPATTTQVPLQQDATAKKPKKNEINKQIQKIKMDIYRKNQVMK